MGKRWPIESSGIVSVNCAMTSLVCPLAHSNEGGSLLCRVGSWCVIQRFTSLSTSQPYCSCTLLSGTLKWGRSNLALLAIQLRSMLSKERNDH
jgi:hypothetical protein